MEIYWLKKMVRGGTNDILKIIASLSESDRSMAKISDWAKFNGTRLINICLVVSAWGFVVFKVSSCTFVALRSKVSLVHKSVFLRLSSIFPSSLQQSAMITFFSKPFPILL